MPITTETRCKYFNVTELMTMVVIDIFLTWYFISPIIDLRSYLRKPFIPTSIPINLILMETIKI